MRRQWAGLPALLIGLWACHSDTLPPEYRRIEVPEARLASAEARAHGRELYLDHCALCHGEKANGVGVRRNLSSRPQSFTDRNWRARTSPRQIFFVIREGVQGTAMPSWDILTEDDSWDLVAYLLQVAIHQDPS